MLSETLARDRYHQIRIRFEPETVFGETCGVKTANTRESDN